MNPTLKDLQQKLKERNISLSHQRLKILEYLAQNRCHPTVDQIFTSLQREISTLSRTTVYNTLHVLAEAGLVRAISVGDAETRYDIATENHGHFKCESCGEIYDFEIDAGRLTSKDLAQFKIQDQNVYFKGLCPKCLAGKQKTR